MFEKIKESFSQFTYLSPKDLIDLAAVIKIKQLEKGEHLVRIGDYNYQAVRVLNGLLCHYVTDENGMEKALVFVPEGMNSGSLQTNLYGKPADENIIALENTLMICIDVRELDRLAADNIRILKMVNQNYKQIIAEAGERIRFLIAHTPEERYLNFCKTYPDLEQRLRQKDLASYLGVTPTSLSRMRARLVKG